MFVEVVQVNVTWISSDDGDQYSITHEEIHDNKRILVQAANNEKENLSRHDYTKHVPETLLEENMNLLYYSSL